MSSKPIFQMSPQQSDQLLPQFIDQLQGENSLIKSRESEKLVSEDKQAYTLMEKELMPLNLYKNTISVKSFSVLNPYAKPFRPQLIKQSEISGQCPSHEIEPPPSQKIGQLLSQESQQSLLQQTVCPLPQHSKQVLLEREQLQGDKTLGMFEDSKQVSNVVDNLRLKDENELMRLNLHKETQSLKFPFALNPHAKSFYPRVTERPQTNKVKAEQTGQLLLQQTGRISPRKGKQLSFRKRQDAEIFLPEINKLIIKGDTDEIQLSINKKGQSHKSQLKLNPHAKSFFPRTKRPQTNEVYAEQTGQLLSPQNTQLLSQQSEQLQKSMSLRESQDAKNFLPEIDKLIIKGDTDEIQLSISKKVQSLKSQFKLNPHAKSFYPRRTKRPETNKLCAEQNDQLLSPQNKQLFSQQSEQLLIQQTERLLPQKTEQLQQNKKSSRKFQGAQNSLPDKIVPKRKKGKKKLNINKPTQCLKSISLGA